MKKKKPDFRKIANKYFRNNPLPFKVAGFGEKKDLICDICKNKVNKLKIFYDKKGKLWRICDNCEVK